MLGASKKEVILYRYTPEWIKGFDKEKKLIESIKFGFSVFIEHIGATALVNSISQNCIDLLVGINSFLDIITARDKLMYNGYYYIAKKSSLFHYVLIKKTKNDLVSHVIHLVIYNSTDWNSAINFKRYLQSSYHYLDAYNTFKKEIASKYKDQIDKYNKEKHSYINRILARL